MSAIFPISYFGNCTYFKEFVLAHSPLLEVKEHFVKQTLRNRCTILTANGPLHLTIPVVRKNGSKTTTEEVEIAHDQDWRKNHWKAIESAYSSAPFFDYYGCEVKELLYQEETNLVRFNTTCMIRILEWFDLDQKIAFSTDFQEDTYETDYRNSPFVSNSPIDFYQQVFTQPSEFIANVSILDLVFCQGPMARKWLVKDQFRITPFIEQHC
jgi:hypothetical protein